MEIPVSPSQDINIRVNGVTGLLSGLNDVTKVWTVQVRLSLETPTWNMDSGGNIIDGAVKVQRAHRISEVGLRVDVSREDIAAAAGLDSPDDVPEMKVGVMETAIIGVAIAKTQSTFGITLPALI